MRGAAIMSVATLFGLFASHPAAAQTFGGVYIGATGGSISATSDARTATIYTSPGYFATTSVTSVNAAGIQRLAPTGIPFSGHAGFNVQVAHFLAGVEADFGVMRLRASVGTAAIYPCCSPTTFTVTQSIKTDRLITVRPRIGVTGARLLVYVTAGLAITNLEYAAVFDDTNTGAHEQGGVTKDHKGWIWGGGAEYAIGHGLSVKGEFLYADFGRVLTTSTNLIGNAPVTAFPANVFTHSTDLRFRFARGGLSYRF